MPMNDGAWKGSLQDCLDTLGDDTESLHAEATPAVWALVAIGLPAVNPLLDRMADADSLTRLRAGHAFMHISMRRFGFDGNRWPDGLYAVWAQWWSGMGYEPRAAADARAAAVARLREAVRAWH